MKTEPRRRDRRIETSKDMEVLLERMPVGRLGIVTEDGPYVVAVNYVFSDGSIYFHGSHTGRKMEALQADARVCFLVDEVGPQVVWDEECGISQIYKSVICFGKAELVENPGEKKRVLEKMVQKYVPSNYPVSLMTDQNIDRTAVVRIAIESMSGKENILSSLHTVLPKCSSETS